MGDFDVISPIILGDDKRGEQFELGRAGANTSAEGAYLEGYDIGAVNATNVRIAQLDAQTRFDPKRLAEEEYQRRLQTLTSIENYKTIAEQRRIIEATGMQTAEANLNNIYAQIATQQANTRKINEAIRVSQATAIPTAIAQIQAEQALTQQRLASANLTIAQRKLLEETGSAEVGSKILENLSKVDKNIRDTSKTGGSKGEEDKQTMSFFGIDVEKEETPQGGKGSQGGNAYGNLGQNIASTASQYTSFAADLLDKDKNKLTAESLNNTREQTRLNYGTGSNIQSKANIDLVNQVGREIETNGDPDSPVSGLQNLALLNVAYGKTISPEDKAIVQENIKKVIDYYGGAETLKRKLSAELNNPKHRKEADKIVNRALALTNRDKLPSQERDIVNAFGNDLDHENLLTKMENPTGTYEEIAKLAGGNIGELEDTRISDSLLGNNYFSAFTTASNNGEQGVRIYSGFMPTQDDLGNVGSSAGGNPAIVFEGEDGTKSYAEVPAKEDKQSRSLLNVLGNTGKHISNTQASRQPVTSQGTGAGQAQAPIDQQAQAQAPTGQQAQAPTGAPTKRSIAEKRRQDYFVITNALNMPISQFLEFAKLVYPGAKYDALINIGQEFIKDKTEFQARNNEIIKQNNTTLMTLDKSYADVKEVLEIVERNTDLKNYLGAEGTLDRSITDILLYTPIFNKLVGGDKARLKELANRLESVGIINAAQLLNSSKLLDSSVERQGATNFSININQGKVDFETAAKVLLTDRELKSGENYIRKKLMALGVNSQLGEQIVQEYLDTAGAYRLNEDGTLYENKNNVTPQKFLENNTAFEKVEVASKTIKSYYDNIYINYNTENPKDTTPPPPDISTQSNLPQEETQTPPVESSLTMVGSPGGTPPSTPTGGQADTTPVSLAQEPTGGQAGTTPASLAQEPTGGQAGTTPASLAQEPTPTGAQVPVTPEEVQEVNNIIAEASAKTPQATEVTEKINTAQENLQNDTTLSDRAKEVVGNFYNGVDKIYNFISGVSASVADMNEQQKEAFQQQYAALPKDVKEAVDNIDKTYGGLGNFLAYLDNIVNTSTFGLPSDIWNNIKDVTGFGDTPEETAAWDQIKQRVAAEHPFLSLSAEAITSGLIFTRLGTLLKAGGAVVKSADLTKVSASLGTLFNYIKNTKFGGVISKAATSPTGQGVTGAFGKGLEKATEFASKAAASPTGQRIRRATENVVGATTADIFWDISYKMGMNEEFNLDAVKKTAYLSLAAQGVFNVLGKGTGFLGNRVKKLFRGVSDAPNPDDAFANIISKAGIPKENILESLNKAKSISKTSDEFIVNFLADLPPQAVATLKEVLGTSAGITRLMKEHPDLQKVFDKYGIRAAEEFGEVTKEIPTSSKATKTITKGVEEATEKSLNEVISKLEKTLPVNLDIPTFQNKVSDSIRKQVNNYRKLGGLSPISKSTIKEGDAIGGTLETIIKNTDGMISDINSTLTGKNSVFKKLEADFNATFGLENVKAIQNTLTKTFDTSGSGKIENLIRNFNEKQVGISLTAKEFAKSPEEMKLSFKYLAEFREYISKLSDKDPISLGQQQKLKALNIIDKGISVAFKDAGVDPKTYSKVLKGYGDLKNTIQLLEGQKDFYYDMQSAVISPSEKTLYSRLFGTGNKIQKSEAIFGEDKTKQLMKQVTSYDASIESIKKLKKGDLKTADEVKALSDNLKTSIDITKNSKFIWDSIISSKDPETVKSLAMVLGKENKDKISTAVLASLKDKIEGYTPKESVVLTKDSFLPKEILGLSKTEWNNVKNIIPEKDLNTFNTYMDKIAKVSRAKGVFKGIEPPPGLDTTSSYIKGVVASRFFRTGGGNVMELMSSDFFRSLSKKEAASVMDKIFQYDKRKLSSYIESLTDKMQTTQRPYGITSDVAESKVDYTPLKESARRFIIIANNLGDTIKEYEQSVAEQRQ